MANTQDEQVAAFEKIYRRCAPKMYRTAIRHFGVPRAVADEIVYSIFACYLTQPEEVENLEVYFLAQVCHASREHLALPGTDVPSL